MIQEKIISIRSISKSFDDVPLFSNISFEVKTGEILGLLGNNGTGKSTLINIIAGFLEAETGCVSISDPNSTVQNSSEPIVQIVTENLALFDRLSIIDNLFLFAELLGLPRDGTKEKIEAILPFLDLAGKKDTLVRNASFGMKKKLAIASTLLTKYDFGVYDEPFDGVDLLTRIKLISLFNKLKTCGSGFIISTHDMFIIHKIATRYIIIADSKMHNFSRLHSAESLEREFVNLYQGANDDLERLSWLY